MTKIKITECPRDAMQGIKEFIPTELKVNYLNSLLECGFDTLDFGSFVSPKAIPQMADTADVLSGISSKSDTKLLAIAPNLKGVLRGLEYKQVHYFGYPFSISEEFQIRNLNMDWKKSTDTVKEILQNLHTDRLIVYISMGFGNPYGEEFSSDIACRWIDKLANIGATKFALSDTIGISDKAVIQDLFASANNRFPELEFGAHFHTKPKEWEEKIDAAYNSGCRWFEGALKGYGGCPLTAFDMIGNTPTENIISYFKERSIPLSVDDNKVAEAYTLSSEIFDYYH